MLNPQRIDQLARKLTDLLPESAGQIHDEVEKNFKAGLQGVMQKMDLVSREEYEIQRDLLDRTRSKLQDLEARIEAIESGESR